MTKKHNELLKTIYELKNQHRAELAQMHKKLKDAKKIASRASVRYPKPEFGLNDIDIAMIPNLWPDGVKYSTAFGNLPTRYLAYILNNGLIVRVGRDMWRYFDGGRWQSSVSTKCLCEVLQNRLKRYCKKSTNFYVMYDKHKPTNKEVFKMFHMGCYEDGYKQVINNRQKIDSRIFKKNLLLKRNIDT